MRNNFLKKLLHKKPDTFAFAPRPLFNNPGAKVQVFIAFCRFTQPA